MKLNTMLEACATHADFHVGNEHSEKSREEQNILFLKTYGELIVHECISYMGKNNDGLEVSFEELLAHFEMV